jgi:acyl-CoA thioesterase-1
MKTSIAALAFAVLCTAATPAAAQPTVIAALGDSNTTGFLVSRAYAFPEVLEDMLRAAGSDVHVKNSGVNGDTTGGMLKRLDEAVPKGTKLAIVQGGYNDLRKGSSTRAIAANIDAILARLKARGVKVVLCGFYQEPWAAIARRHGATHVPSTSCYDDAYRGFDGVHMNAEGHRVVAARLFPVVQKLLAAP